MTEPKQHAGDKRRRRGRPSEPHHDKSKSKHNNNNNNNKMDSSKNSHESSKNKKNNSSVAAPSQHTTLLLQLTEDASKWYLIGKQLPERNETISQQKQPEDKTNNSKTNNNITKNTPAVVTKYRQQADDLFRQEIALALSNKSKDDAWMESTMRKGTLKDRIAAMSVVLSQSPIHQFHVLQQLMDMTRPNNNSRVAQLAAEALLDLWLHTYVPSQRPLVSLTHRPLMRYHENVKETLSPRILLLWRFEEMIMEQYLTFLQQYLKYTLQEGLETQKIFCLKSAATLLQRIPTGEQTLLSLLVNKLGDPARKIAARAAHELRGILFHHPAMQPVVAREVQQTVHRPHLSPKALYHCILFLNQFEFSSRNPQSVALATSLIQTYFQLFEWAITGRSTITAADSKKSKAPADAKLNSRLLSALLTGVNRAHPYVDASHDMEQYLDALYRVVHTAPPAACTQAMLLLFHLVIGVEQKQLQEQKEKQRRNRKKTQAPVAAAPPPQTTPEHEARRTRFYRALYAKLIDTQLLYSGKHLTQFFNLLYKSFKYDTNERRIQACCKRLVSTIMSCPNAATLTATLYLWHEVARIHPFLQQSYAQVVPEDAEFILDGSKRDPRSALVQMENGVVATALTDADDIGHVNAPVWEMSLLQHHYHPSVVKFTHSLDADLGYNGDPLHDFAFGSFLDKFAYRNPKTSQRATEQTRSAVMERHRSSTPMIPVNDRSFLQKNEVGPEDEFFFRFFEERAKRDQVKGIVRYKETKKGKKDDDDDDSQGLLDKIEQNNVDDQYDDDFDEYEQAWEDDPEEEAFVDSLAESLMEDAMDMPSDLDDEDPDTEGWDDLHDNDDNDHKHVARDSDEDDEDDDDVVDVKGSDNASSASPEDGGDDDDDDAFMDQSDDSDSDEMPPKLVLEDDEDDDDQEEEDKGEFEENIDDEDEDDEEEDDDAELLFMAGGMGDDDDEELENDEAEALGFHSNKKAKFESSVFASAEDYEERIEESFRELRSFIVPVANHEDENESMEDAPAQTQQKPKKRKKNKKKR